MLGIRKNHQKLAKAFSLIELSIVILIIGILVAGVTQSSRLINAMRLQTFRSLTLNSPVSSINGLVLWLETTLEKSFDPIQASNGSEISTWFDINPQTTTPLNATQATTGRKPTYNSVGNIPVITFNGVDNGQFFSLPNNTIPSGDSAYTIIAVFKLASDANVKNHDFISSGYWVNPINLIRLYSATLGSFTLQNFSAGGSTSTHVPGVASLLAGKTYTKSHL